MMAYIVMAIAAATWAALIVDGKIVAMLCVAGVLIVAAVLLARVVPNDDELGDSVGVNVGDTHDVGDVGDIG